MQPRRRGTEALIDEDQMIKALDVTITSESAQQVQSGAYMLLLDAWDRKLTRDQFITAIGTAHQLIDACARISLMSNVKDHYKATGGVSEVDIENALAGCGIIGKQAVIEAVKMGNLLKQLPTHEDPIS